MRIFRNAMLASLAVLLCVMFLTASIPNVSSGTWHGWNAMTDARSAASAVLLSDGRVLIAGGSNANGPTASADLFRADGVFSAAAAMHSPRSNHTATLLGDGRVLVTGGTTSGGGITNSAEIYDPGSDSWTVAGTMLDARAGHSASSLSDGRVLLAGGHDSAGNAISSLEIFDPASGAFTSAGAMSLPRMNHAAATLSDGRVVLIGGTADGTSALATVDIYDPSAGTVSAGPNLSTPRMAATATTTLDGKVAVIGGSSGYNTSGAVDLASAEVFDPVTGAFNVSASNLAVPRSGHHAFLLPKNNSILIVGGTSGGADLSSAELYLPWSDTFQTTGAMSVARPGMTGSALGWDGRFLAAGGTNLASTELYGFSTVQTDAADYPPGSVVTITGSGWRPGETVTLTLVESPLLDTHGPYNVTADANGNISDSSFVTDDHDLNIQFYLTAVGLQSGSQAQNAFTDSNPGSLTLTPGTVTVAPGGAADYTITVLFGGNGASCTVNLSIAGLPTGASGAPSPASVSGINGDTKTSTVHLTTTATGGGATPPGPYTITATGTRSSVGGSSCQGNSTLQDAATLAVVESTATTLTSSLNPSTFGQTITLTATVAQVTGPTKPTGSVTFKDGATTLGTGALNGSGVATLAISTLTAGSHSLTASYAGTVLFGTSTSNTVSQAVNQASTTTTVARTTGPNPSVFGQSLTFTATVAAVGPGAGTPTGTVTFTDGATTIGTGTLNGSGVATLTSATLAVGSHSITATYNADANFTGSTSAALAQTVNTASTTTTITSDSPDPSVVGQLVIINFTVAAVTPGSGTPTGTVTVSDGTQSCSASVATGTCSITFTTAGAKSLTASYPGDTNFTLSASTPATPHTVTTAATTTTITAHTPNPSLVNQPITVNFTVTANSPASGTATGNVTVSDGTGDTCVGTVAAGTCQLTATTSGAKTFTASYATDGNFAASTSAGVSHNVNQAPTITSANSTTFTVGTAGSFTVTASGFPAPTFSETGPLPGGVTLNTTTGLLSGTPAANTGGTYPITITASNGISPNATQSFTLTVNQAPAVTSANSAGFIVNQAGSFTVMATGFPAPTFSETGALPNGVTLSAAGVLSGTATVTGNFPITLTASNGVLPNATQSFTLTVGQPPAITSANNAALSVETPGSFTVTATGFPVPTFTETGALPSGVTLTSAGVLNGTPALGTVGTYPITITASNGVGTNATQSFTLTVNKITPTFSGLTASQSLAFGTPSINLSGRLNGFAMMQGTVTITINGVVVSGIMLNGNPNNFSTTFNTSTIPASTTPYTITYSYSSDANSTTATDNTTTLTVNKASTAFTGLASHTITFGTSSVTLSGTIAAGSLFPPSGETVNISINSVTMPATIGANGTFSAVFDTHAIPASITPYIVTYSYPGDTNFSNAINNATSLTVNKATSTTALLTSPNPSFSGQQVTLTASVTAASGVPTGSVQFQNGGVNLGSPVTLVNNGGVFSAQLQTSVLSVGTHNITAIYGGDGNISGSTSNGVAQVVKSADTTTSISAPPITFGADGLVTVTVTPQYVSAGTPFGNVTLSVNGGAPISQTLVSGSATFTITQPNAGTYALAATYAAQNNFNASSASGSLLVSQAQATLSFGTLTFTYDGNPQPVTVTTSPLGLNGVAITYNGSPAPPTSAGSYAVVASLSNQNYSATPISGTEVILQVTPTISWANPADITYGTPLGAAQLTATASVLGAFVYSPAAGTVLNAGNGQILSVAFIPTDTVDFATASASVQINVLPATPSIVWENPADITYGTALGNTQLNAIALPPASALTGWWKGDGDANDSAGANNGIPTGVTFPAGKIGQAFSFAGAGDGVTIGANSGYDLNASGFTAAFWVQGSHNANGPESILDKSYDSGSNTGWAFQVDNTNGYLDFAIGEGTTSHKVTSSVDVLDGNFHFITGTWDGGLTMELFVDGISQGKKTLTAAPANNTGDLTVGFSSVTAQPFTGLIDEVQIFRQPLPAGAYAYTPAAATVLNASPNPQTLSVTFTATDTTNLTPASKSVQINVNRAAADITVTPYDITYDASAHTATGTATGVGAVDLSAGLNLTGTTHTNAGTYTDTWTYTDATGNYSDATGTVTDAIGKANATISVTPYNFTYDGGAHTATGTAKGVLGETLAGLDLSGTTHTSAGTFTDTWTFTDVTGNYKDATGTVQDVIKKATATIVVTPYNVTYDGDPHTATGTATGVLGENLAAGLDLSGTTHTNAGTTPDTWTFTDATGNYYNATGTVTDVINRADPIVTAMGGTFTYDGNPHGGSGKATGVKGEDLTPVNVAYKDSTPVVLSSPPVNAGTYSVAARYAGDANYNPKQSASAPLIINKADAVIAVTPYSITYDGNPHTATGTAHGVEIPTPSDLSSLLHLGGTTHTYAGDYAAESWTFDGNVNYNSTSGTVHDHIDKATANIVVTSYSVTYDGNSHTATGSATGVESPTPADLSALLNLTGTTHTGAGDYPADSWSFAGNNNYNPASAAVHDHIDKATANIVVTPYNVIYDASAHTATGTAKGVLGESLAGLDLTGTIHTYAGTTVDPWTFTDVTGNYNNANSSVTDVINKADAVISVTPYGTTYDGNPHTATGSAHGVESPIPADLSVLLNLSATTHTNAGDYLADSWSFAGNNNYKPASGTAHDAIARANAVVVVTGYTLFYDGSTHTASGSATGVKGEGLAGLDLSTSVHMNAAVYTDSWTFDDATGNYNSQTGMLIDTISADVTTTTLADLPNPSNYTQPVTFTATVKNQYMLAILPTGGVAFYNASSGASCSNLGTSTVFSSPAVAVDQNGQASFSIATLQPGTYSVLACYVADSVNFQSSGTSVSQTVIPAPVVSLNSTSLSFGNTQAGSTSSPAMVTVSNLGTAPLLFSSFSITGTNASYFAFVTPSTGTDCRTVGAGGLAVNANCNLAAVFKPLDTGVATAIINITDNDRNIPSSVQQVLLTGAGTSSINSVGALFSYGIFATANGCGSLTVSGNSSVDSFDSGLGYSSSHQNSGGNVGTNGNLTLNGSNVTIYGSASVPTTKTGNCSTSNPTGLSSNGGAQVTGGLMQLPLPVIYASPAAPTPMPPTTNQSISGSCGTISGCTNNGSKNVILAPGQYGNLSVTGGTTVHVSIGTYNMNSLTLSGNATLVVDSGSVVVNIAGVGLSSGAIALDLSGGSMSNASGTPGKLQFYYGGSRSTKLSGGAGNFAVVYAPSSPITISGGSHFYGAIVGNTIAISGGTAVHYDRSLPFIAGGNYIWFNSAAVNVQGLPSNATAKLFVTNASIKFTANSTNYNLPVPNAVITFSPTATSASTSWDSINSRWQMLVPRSMVAGGSTVHTFLDGVTFPVPMNFPSGIQNATWSAAFATDTPGVTFQWQWAAAVYSSFSTIYSNASNNNILGVNPVDNSDSAGTPENYKQFLTPGGSGGGAGNWTGFYVGTAGVVPTMAPASVSPSSLNFGSVTVNTTSPSMTAVLSNNQSAPLTITSISKSGTNANDFDQTSNCPISPATLAGGGASCTIAITFKPTATGARKAKFSVNDDANNTPQTVFVSGTGQ
ncbi:MAG: Ig-like domain repeat protein [Terriglobales bacterium]